MCIRFISKSFNVINSAVTSTLVRNTTATYGVRVTTVVCHRQRPSKTETETERRVWLRTHCYATRNGAEAARGAHQAAGRIIGPGILDSTPCLPTAASGRDEAADVVRCTL